MTTTTSDAWEADIAGLLGELADVQRDLLDALTRKRQLVAAGDEAALATSAHVERQLLTRLEASLVRRKQLLDQAAVEGRPADSIRALSRSLTPEARDRLQPNVEQALHRSRLLQHECLTNWVLVQRSLLHLAQMLEIIATGGRMKPTYGNGSDRQHHGALVDRTV